jgi:hypothetical protein
MGNNFFCKISMKLEKKHESGNSHKRALDEIMSE